MPDKVDPKQLGLPPRTVLEQVDARTIAIVIDRKSRIIMADGRKILDKALKIKKTQPAVSVALKTSAPICSKTIRFLDDHGIAVISLED